MKLKVVTVTEREATHIRIVAPVRYEEEDIPNDFPLRKGDVWDATVEIATGKIVNWPKLEAAAISGPLHAAHHADPRPLLKLYMKVVDTGSYYLLGPNFEVLAAREQEYVPHCVVPGSYGDYIELEISPDGLITNWPRNPSAKDFEKRDDE